MDEPWVPVGNTNRYLKSLRYRLMLPTGIKGSSMSYFKKKISIFSSKVMCRRDGKKDTRETRDSVFESCPTTFAKKILAIGTGSFTRCSWPWLLVSVSGYRFKNRYLSPSPTGAYGHFSSSVLRPFTTHNYRRTLFHNFFIEYIGRRGAAADPFSSLPIMWDPHLISVSSIFFFSHSLCSWGRLSTLPGVPPSWLHAWRG